MLTGTFTAIVTPFRGGEVDHAALSELIKTQIKGGVDGVVPAGTTGESPTLKVEEHIDLVAATVKYAAGKTKVVAGSGANSTEEAIYLTQAVEKVGADASLQVAPYYNRPTQEGLFRHFQKVAQSTRLPIILYSIPGRCGVEIAVETVARLAESCPNIVGIKEAGGSVDRVSQLRQVMASKFSILSGDDALTIPFLSVGACGVVSVASNIIPKELTRMVRLYLNGELGGALKLHERYYPIFKDLFVESNPAPVKAALAMMGRMEEEVRLPLVSVSERSREILRATLLRCGILK